MYVLSLIPAIGLLVALTIFICYDCHALEATLHCFWTVVKTFVQKPKGSKVELNSFEKSETFKDFKRNPMIMTKTDEIVQCIVCYKQVSNSSNNILQHMLKRRKTC